MAAVAGVLLGSLAFPSSAAAAGVGDVVINEIMYHPVSDNDAEEFLELRNTAASSADISGWCFTSGISLCFPTGTTIAAGGYLVVSPDATQFHATYGGSPAAVYSGKLSNSGEKITLSDAIGAVDDTVTYAESDPWAVTPDGGGPSLELLDPGSDHNDSLNWAASTVTTGNTVGTANSVSRIGVAPRITAVTAGPTTPAAKQSVTVTGTVVGATSATLRYKTDFGAERSVGLTLAGDGSFQSSIPGAAAGHLIRYRGGGHQPGRHDVVTASRRHHHFPGRRRGQRGEQRHPGPRVVHRRR